MHENTPPALRWDLFCRVVDNFGDLGVCWRLACDLHRQGQRVRLWVDDPGLAARMTHPRPGLELVPWTDPPPPLQPLDVVVEAFGCDPPDTFVEAMAAMAAMPAMATTANPADAPAELHSAHRASPPVWINLEYLTAETYAQRSHGLPSPQLSGAGQGLSKWFFYPGFHPATGGLIREADLAARQRAFDRDAWLSQWGPWEPDRPFGPRRERVVSLFAYPSAPLERLLDDWARAPEPTWLLVAWGELQARAAAWLRDRPEASAWLRITPLPWLSQEDFDHLLWSCDLNFVRGEDSLVRAIWAGKPFVWQLYPQTDGAHEAKLAAFLHAAPGLEGLVGLQAAWRAWCGLAPWPGDNAPRAAASPSFAQGDPALQAAWGACVQRWAAVLAERPSLTTRLIDFAVDKLGGKAAAQDRIEG